ncbi:vegetative cell wall protein gp1-like [Toxotes jaculatrix]|uniref:vegetative cell wall protein gp1-like n=1 Tax=Toxotes jaculatrix TaxID=941984 RepID=UPI001B3A872F|nr:vegetative cell wall protein gp1-like [Toxotes jaculatrix]
MDSVDLTLSLCTAIYDMVENTKANKDRCQRVTQRVKSLEDLVRTIQQRGTGQISPTVDKALRDLSDTLLFAKDIILKFGKTKGVKSFLNNKNLEEQFSKVNERLTDNFQILSGALQIEQGNILFRVYECVAVPKQAEGQPVTSGMAPLHLPMPTAPMPAPMATALMPAPMATAPMPPPMPGVPMPSPMATAPMPPPMPRVPMPSPMATAPMPPHMPIAPMPAPMATAPMPPHMPRVPMPPPMPTAPMPHPMSMTSPTTPMPHPMSMNSPTTPMPHPMSMNSPTTPMPHPMSMTSPTTPMPHPMSMTSPTTLMPPPMSMTSPTAAMPPPMSLSSPTAAMPPPLPAHHQTPVSVQCIRPPTMPVRCVMSPMQMSSPMNTRPLTGTMAQMPLSTNIVSQHVRAAVSSVVVSPNTASMPLTRPVVINTINTYALR